MKKPAPTSPEYEKAALDQQRSKNACDTIVERAAMMMLEAGAPADMVIDRLLTFAGAMAAKINGSPRTARAFRRLAANIDAGVFHSITGESAGKGH
mgnify:CR=1 FL=1